MTVRFHTREQTGLQPANLARLRRRTTDEITRSHEGLTWHWVGDGGTLFHPDPRVRLQGIQHYHMNVRGYGDIAYHGAYDADGNTYELRGSEWVGAHALSNRNEANALTDGIVFLEDRRGWTHDALHAFVWWCDLYKLTHARPPTLFSHAWWSRGHGGTVTACPGPYIVDTVRYLHGNA